MRARRPIGIALRYTILILLSIVLFAGCPSSERNLRRTLVRPEHVEGNRDRLAGDFLKAHMRDGNVVVFAEWQVNDRSRTVVGHATVYDPGRRVLRSGAVTIPIDSVALFETNTTSPTATIAALTMVTGISVAVTALCLTNPKACFGSCPTFYVPDERGGESLQAEGFSASILPSLEATDVEALETHVIRHADILAAPRPEGEHVVAATDGTFGVVSAFTAPTSCVGPEGDCRAAVAAWDDAERTSTTDSTDLGAEETITATFPAMPGDSAGLFIAARQSLLTTYLIYQRLAYLGHDAGHWLAKYERGRAGRRTNTAFHMVSRMTVLARNAGGAWVPIDTLDEVGPLAVDTKVVPLPAGTREVRLSMVRGAWRINWLARASLGARVTPVRISPALVVKNGMVDESARQRLLDPDSVLVAMPGDEHRLVYRLPEGYERAELFLESRGYYIEWFRDEWLADESLYRSAMFTLRPRHALRTLAPEFKRIEGSMEEAFWRSRYARP